jgi:hypothetical protein
MWRRFCKEASKKQAFEAAKEFKEVSKYYKMKYPESFAEIKKFMTRI